MSLELSPYAWTILGLLLISLVWKITDKIKERNGYQHRQKIEVERARAKTAHLKATLPDDPQSGKRPPKEGKWHHQKESSRWL